MKILYVSQYYPPEMGAPAARASELAREWVRMGHEVTVLTGFPNHPTGAVPPQYRGKLWRLRMQEQVDGVNVERTWLLPLPNGRPHERILNYGSFCLSAAFSGSFLARPDIIVATSPQLLVGLSGWWISRYKGVPLIFEVRDLWPESLIAVGAGREGSWFYRSLSRLAQFLYRKAERIVVVSPAFKNFLEVNRGITPAKIDVVANAVETELFSPRDADPALKRSLNLEGKCIVGYIGTMGMAHGLESLLQAAETLQRSAPQVEFLLVGEGSEKAKLQKQAQSRGLANLRFLPEVRRDRVPEYIALCDICLVVLRKSEIFKTVIPTKMLEYMACARAVILGVDGQACEIINQARAGISVAPDDSAALSQAIIDLANDQELRKRLGRNGRLHIERHFSRRKSAEAYLDLLESVLRTEEGRQILAA